MRRNGRRSSSSRTHRRWCRRWRLWDCRRIVLEKELSETVVRTGRRGRGAAEMDVAEPVGRWMLKGCANRSRYSSAARSGSWAASCEVNHGEAGVFVVGEGAVRCRSTRDLVDGVGFDAFQRVVVRRRSSWGGRRLLPRLRGVSPVRRSRPVSTWPPMVSQVLGAAFLCGARRPRRSLPSRVRMAPTMRAGRAHLRVSS